MKKKLTAAELMAKLNADPEFVARRQRKEAKLQKLVDELRQALAPLVQELRAAGCNITSTSELTSKPYPKSAPYPNALPILLAHLQRPYVAKAREIIAYALAVPEAKFAWGTLTRLYREEQEAGPKDALAVAIAAAADNEVIEDVIALARDTRNGPSRLLLLSALERSPDPRATATLMDLETDPELTKEIQVILRRRKRRRR
jgi:hypothetical protein